MYWLQLPVYLVALQHLHVVDLIGQDVVGCAVFVVGAKS